MTATLKVFWVLKNKRNGKHEQPSAYIEELPFYQSLFVHTTAKPNRIICYPAVDMHPIICHVGHW